MKPFNPATSKQWRKLRKNDRIYKGAVMPDGSPYKGYLGMINHHRGNYFEFDLFTPRIRPKPRTRVKEEVTPLNAFAIAVPIGGTYHIAVSTIRHLRSEVIPVLRDNWIGSKGRIIPVTISRKAKRGKK